MGVDLACFHVRGVTTCEPRLVRTKALNHDHVRLNLLNVHREKEYVSDSVCHDYETERMEV